MNIFNTWQAWVVIYLFAAVLFAQAFKKANRNMLIGFVPFYNDYVLCKITGTNICWFYLKIGLPVLLAIMEEVISPAYDGLSSLQIFVYIGYWVALSASLSKSFGKGMFTTVCHFLFPQITRFIVASTSQYLGPRGCNDIVFDKANFGTTKVEVNNNPVSNDHPEYHFCPSCGNAITEYDRFCNKCGREI